MIFFFRPRLTPRAFSFFISLLPFFFFSAGYDPAFFVCLFRRIVSGMFIVHCAGCHPACPSYPLIHSSPSLYGEGRGGVIPSPSPPVRHFPFLYPPRLADWKCRFVPLPLHGGVGGGFLIYDFLSFSAFFPFSSCIFHFFVVPLHPITILLYDISMLTVGD